MEVDFNRQHIEHEILNYILTLSLEDMTFDELLGRCLDEILSIPFEGFKSIGSILTFDKGPDTINMEVSKGTRGHHHNENIKDVPLGRCICRKVAESGKTEFIICANECLDITNVRTDSHGHYYIPIKIKNDVLGVVNIYVDEGFGRNEEDVIFLESIAATLAGIIERRRIEDKLKDSERKYRETINTTREGYWVLDGERKIIDVNESFCIMLGYSREEILGKEPGDLVDEENAKIFSRHLAKISSTKHRVYEILFKCKNGENLPAIIHATTLRDKDGAISSAFAFITDISELKKVEAKLRLAKEEAEGATKLKDKFVSLVSHDLKNPINEIMLSLDTLQAIEQVSDNGKAVIEDAIETCDEMTALINEVLNLSRIRGSIIMPENAFFKLHVTVDMAIKNYERLAAEKGIKLINEIPIRAKIYADKRLLLEVLRNLISNAVKFCKTGDRVNLYILDGKATNIVVSDTGVGIKPLKLDTLFRYEEKKSTRGTLGEAGTGFGLPLCHDIIRAQGGRLEVESEVGKGSTFYIKLPDAKPTVFVVDDNELIRELCTDWLKKLEIEIMVAANGETALELIKKYRPQLLFVDLHMPGMSGLELIEQIKKTPNIEKIPVIAITSDKKMEVVDRAFQRGADDFIVKPFVKEDLVACVKRFVL